jgi:hypothetical protein
MHSILKWSGQNNNLDWPKVAFLHISSIFACEIGLTTLVSGYTKIENRSNQFDRKHGGDS